MPFSDLSTFQPSDSDYSFLPFRFTPLDKERYVVTNIAGEFLVLPRNKLHAFVRHTLTPSEPAYKELKSKHFLADTDSLVPHTLLATQYRTKAHFLTEFTSLHIFVVTLRCNNRCIYCQASRQREDQQGFDMSTEVADKAIDFMFRSPSRCLKVEFQGGEPLLKFPVVRYIVERTREKANELSRPVEFVICSNLSLLNSEILKFCEENNVYLSTSLDGPKTLHNYNRPSSHFDSYEQTVQSIRRAMDYLGPAKVSALMTTTRKSLSYPREIVDEYVKLGFSSVFLRMINPYGLAARVHSLPLYSASEWLEFYKNALSYVLDLNYQGIEFREDYASLILRKILTSYGTGFVDLQSPSGIGISVLVFHYDGDIYLSDESRMLAEMGDKQFRLGSLLTDAYEEVMLSEDVLSLVSSTMNEGVPGCCDCAFLPFCGSDPVRHYRMQGDVVGNKPTSSFCQKHMGLFRHLISLLVDDPKAAAVFRQWARG